MLSASTIKAIHTIIAGMAGNAAWDKFKDSVPALQHAGTPAFAIGVVVFAVALALMSGHDEPVEDTPAASRTWWRGHERGWMFAIGLMVLALYWCGVYFYKAFWPAGASAPNVVISASSPLATAVQPESRTATSREAEVAAAVRNPSRPSRGNQPKPPFDSVRLAGRSHVTAMVAKGEPDVIGIVADVLDVPLDRKVLTSSFFSEQLFERALMGDPDLFAGHAIPAALERILAVKIERTLVRKVSVPDGAVSITGHLRIAIIDVQASRILFKTQVTVEGTGFTEEFAYSAWKDNLENALLPAKRALASGRELKE